MSRLAELCRRRGDIVTGSDILTGGHCADNVRGADLVVYTGAAADDNPELAEARRLGIPTVSRAKMLSSLASEYPKCAGIAGCHGKTTATALTGFAISSLGPEVHMGGGCDFPHGSGVFVTEACEYKRSFLELKPDIAVVLNVGLDHTDCYADIGEIFDAYRAFALSAPLRIVNGDDAYCRCIEGAATFGRGENCAYRAVNVCCGRDLSFDLIVRGRYETAALLPLRGGHNVYNALAAVAVADALGVPPVRACLDMKAFKGVDRRFEYVGNLRGAEVYTDYAHHPDEIKASLETARSICRGKVIAVFEPHTYTRTASFADGFATALCLADEVVLAPIYAAREKPVTGVCSQSIWLKMRERCRNAVCLPTYCEINAYVRSGAGEGDLVIYLGAGTINRAAAQLCVSP